MKIKKIAVQLLFCIAIPCSISCSAQESGNIKLPVPQLDKGRPLMQVINDRKSTRSFSTQILPWQELSNLLWAGFGINRPDKGGRTAPSAMDQQEIDVYVTLSSGLFLYDAKFNVLRQIHNKDIRALTGQQDFVKNAAANIVFVANYSRTKMGDVNTRKMFAGIDAAYISENMYLYCASEGLATVVRASIDKIKLGEAMQLNKDQDVVLAQSVGYPKK
jgi:nitroreductase